MTSEQGELLARANPAVVFIGLESTMPELDRRWSS
jgi:hypothetical protein